MSEYKYKTGDTDLNIYMRVMEVIMDGLKESITGNKKLVNSPEAKSLENEWIIDSLRNCIPLLEQKLEETRLEFNRVIRENDTKSMYECVTHQREIRQGQSEFAFLF
jgi:hypothetical protein